MQITPFNPELMLIALNTVSNLMRFSISSRWLKLQHSLSIHS